MSRGRRTAREQSCAFQCQGGAGWELPGSCSQCEESAWSSVGNRVGSGARSTCELFPPDFRQLLSGSEGKFPVSSPVESWQLRSQAVLTVLLLFRGTAAAAHQPTLFSPHIKPPSSPSPPSLPSLQPLLKCGSKAGKPQWLRSCRPRSPSAARTSCAEGL